MELWQKLLIAFLSISLVASLTFGFLKHRELKEREVSIIELQNKIAELSTEDFVAVLKVSDNIKSGTLFDPTKVEIAMLPTKLDNDTYIKDPSVLKDAIWRLDINKDTLISEKMLALEPIFPTDRYQLIMVDSLTPSLEVGDFIDLRMITPSGIDFTVLPKKRVVNIYSSGIELIVSETERMIYGGSQIDKAMNRGTVTYADKYVDPTLQNKLYSTYIPPDEIVDYMNMNKNMLFPYIDSGDIRSLRTYIESTQPWNKYKDTVFTSTMEEIRDKETKISSMNAAQVSAMHTARSEYVSYMREKAELEGTTWNGTNTQSTQTGVVNVQDGQLSGGAKREDSINPDGTYIDANGVKRKADGTPVIKSTDIVNFDEDKPDEAPVEGNAELENENTVPETPPDNAGLDINGGVE